MTSPENTLITRAITVIIFFITPSVIYAGLITNFSFNLFTYEDYWKAYNELAQSMLDGRLDVSMEAVGPEGQYYKDKVYMYYGILPALLRVLVSPFFDLNTVPLGNLSVWLMTTLAAASLQYTLLLKNPATINKQWNRHSVTLLLFYSTLIWFGSAYFIIIMKGNLLHEPYAATLMVSSFFIAVVWKDIFLDRRNPNYLLVIYACLAALSLHTRQTVAISLYTSTVLLIFLATTEKYKHQFGYKYHVWPYLRQLIITGYKPLIILGISGIALLLLNYARFDEFWTLNGGDWGYTRADLKHTATVCSRLLTDSPQFDFQRILPNLHFYLFGNFPLHNEWIQNLGLGYVRKEWPFALLKFLWLGNLFIFSYFIILIVKNTVTLGFKEMHDINLMTFSLSISTLLLLSYLTITFRYVADLWPLFMFAYLISFRHLIELQQNSLFRKYFNLITVLLILVLCVNLYRSWYVYSRYATSSNLYEDGMPSNDILERLKNPPKSEWDIKKCIEEYDIKCSVSNTEKQQFSDCRFGRFRLRSQSQDFQPE